MSIIILEGSDCSGKSTLAEALAKHTGYEIVKGSSFEISSLGVKEMYKYTLGLLERDNIIIDRFIWSNMVYANIFNYPKLNEEQITDVLVDLDNRKDATVIYLYTDIGTILGRLSQRGDEYIKDTDIESIIRGYKDEMFSAEYSPVSMMSFNTGLLETWEISESIMKNL